VVACHPQAAIGEAAPQSRKRHVGCAQVLENSGHSAIDPVPAEEIFPAVSH
jgi:hypothetical protein